jgi:serine/threonine protein kinase
MTALTSDRWHAASPYLDRVLEMSPEDRQAWLAALREEHPALADDVAALLDEHDALDRERFLEDVVDALPPHSSLAGLRVGAYTVVSEIGRGGMGSVWLAVRSDGRFEGRVAVKFLNAALAGRAGEARFKREGSILGRLTHPHVAHLLDAGVSETGQPYLVLEHVDGESIDHYCDRYRLDIDARIRLFLDVLTAVAHAHANLIVHRDIKPSNVLVTTDGQVKLLDFGIAKLLEGDDHSASATLMTREGGAAMTLASAAPEQVTGGSVSTATDVYALGVLLYVLLTGQHPAGDHLHSPADLVRAIVDTEPVRASEAVVRSGAEGQKLGRALRGDLDTIIAKALKKNPDERYSVAALAEDLRRYLADEPISARPDTIVYRTGKFLRRNRLPVAAALLTVAGLSVGLYAANRQRVIAERRFVQVRQLADKLFDIDREVLGLAGAGKVRQMIVETSLDYLRRLSADAAGDSDLTLEIGTAYMRVARVQGVPVSETLGQTEQAEQNLRTAESLVSSVLAVRPRNRTAFLRMAQIAHDRMTLAALRRPDDEALPLARKSAEWLDKYFDSGVVDRSEGQQVLLVSSNVANRYRIEHLFAEALRLNRRALEIAPSLNQNAYIGILLNDRAMIHRERGEFDDALSDFREAARLQETEAGTGERGRILNFVSTLTRLAAILGADHGPSLGRQTEAIPLLERAFKLSDDFVHKSPTDPQSRGRLSTAGIALADLLRHSDAPQAIAVYDHVLMHLREIKNYPRFKRDEVRVLAGSTYPLREVGRSAEGRERLEKAFGHLKELKLYPAEQIQPGSEADDALCALADQELAIGHVGRSVEIYRDVLARVLAADPKPENNLADAAHVSRLYASLALVQRQAGQPDLASALDARRSALWQLWTGQLENNPFVLRQLTATGSR